MNEMYPLLKWRILDKALRMLLNSGVDFVEIYLELNPTLALKMENQQTKEPSYAVVLGFPLGSGAHFLFHRDNCLPYNKQQRRPGTGDASAPGRVRGQRGGSPPEALLSGL
jgi:hypothetical protein